MKIYNVIDPIEILNVFKDKFYHNISNGVLSYVLEERLKLITCLKSKNNVNIKSWAIEAEKELIDDIKRIRMREEERARNGFETFE